MAGIAEPLAPARPAKPPADGCAPWTLPMAGVRELLVIALFVALADTTLYRGAGYAGIAALFIGAPILLLLGAPVRKLRGSFWLIGAMLLILAARMLWLGSPLGVVLGASLIVAYALTLRGIRPYVFNVLAGAAQLTVAGAVGMVTYRQVANGIGPRLSKPFALHVVLPVGAVALFGTLFVLANPDLVTSVATGAERFFRLFSEWADGLSQNWLEVGFCLVSAYVVIGLLRPLVTSSLTSDSLSLSAIEAEIVDRTDSAQWSPRFDSPLYGPLRNMLWAVIALFLVYLIIRVSDLMVSRVPEGLLLCWLRA